MAKITKTVVDGATKRDRPYILWDTELTGFGLRVLPTGVKSFILNYRNARNRQCQLTLGKFSESFTADQARKKANTLLREIADGADPLAEKRERRKAATVGELLDLYLASEKFAGKAESTKAIDRGRIARHLKPLLGKRVVDDLRPEDVRRAQAAIKDGKTAGTFKSGKLRGVARVTGGENTARDGVVLLRSVFNWAIGEGLAASNPAASLKVGSSRKREAILEDAAAYGRLFETMTTMENEKRLRPAVADAIRVLALTGARKSEIAALRWGHVDLKAGRIVLPPASHKSGKRTGQDRIISLDSTAQGILARQPAGKPASFVFPPSRGSGGCISLGQPWREIRAEAKLPPDIGLHGLRHSTGSAMAMAGASGPEIMAALGHRQLSTTVRYLHFAQDARSQLAKKAAATALAGMAKAEGKPPADVTPIGGRRRRKGS